MGSKVEVSEEKENHLKFLALKQEQSCECFLRLKHLDIGDIYVKIIDDGSTDGSLELLKSIVAQGAFSAYKTELLKQIGG